MVSPSPRGLPAAAEVPASHKRLVEMGTAV